MAQMACTPQQRITGLFLVICQWHRYANNKDAPSHSMHLEMYVSEQALQSVMPSACRGIMTRCP